ncbi:type 2 periplasmic-binding domain-containing protein [Pseudogulbenkiania subflava]|uniref:Extracellular solute-binding protein, family 3 n=1 Tax=Pseudogulbenkiania subflava DSM 22618 TaxID=1123014 RepID=A0A1Y6C9F0_9NEIS|nr:transporter substrate-binding domain-containing protein [Pseudogulbenkiania subflava]SMF43181.1 extracellular solute-binding protein, family 3 [Pseudogulbenkiania subflava DSM 22618]
MILPVVLASLCLIGASTLAQAEVIVYPRPEAVGDARTDYPLILLRLAFAKAGANHQLRASEEWMQQGRALNELARGNTVRVAWSMTSIEREAALRPIRIPINKGLIGWRLPLVRAEQANLLAGVRTVQDLRHFIAGQGHDWPDTDILRGNGLKVVGVPQYENLFRMLVLKRFDYFPRSLIEIRAEAERHRADGIVIDQHLVIRYPTAFYFFVNRRDTALATTIERGLERAIADGSFDRLFCRHYAGFIEQARLEKRTVIELDNPILPPQTPLGRKELWFRPGLCPSPSSLHGK